MNHDTKCPRCKGSGERMIRVPSQALKQDIGGMDLVTIHYEFKIVDCMVCTGTGLVEQDDYWEGA